MLCLTVEEASGAAVDVWPDNDQAVSVFVQMSTQWRSGGMGATGLDYGVLYHKMDRMRLSTSEYSDLENDIRVLEGAALDQMRENK